MKNSKHQNRVTTIFLFGQVDTTRKTKNNPNCLHNKRGATPVERHLFYKLKFIRLYIKYYQPKDLSRAVAWREDG